MAEASSSRRRTGRRDYGRERRARRVTAMQASATETRAKIGGPTGRAKSVGPMPQAVTKKRAEPPEREKTKPTSLRTRGSFDAPAALPSYQSVARKPAATSAS